MRPFLRLGRVRLGHVETTDAAGQPAKISWEHISGWPRLCRPSEVAEMLHPGLPRFLLISLFSGKHTIERVRERIIRRQFETGTYDRFWQVTPPATPGEFFVRVGGATLLALTFGIFALYKITTTEIAAVDAEAAAACMRDFWYLVSMMTVVAVLGTTLLSFVISFDQSSSEPTLAVRTKAGGFDRYLVSGAVRSTAWHEAADATSKKKRRNVQGLEICQNHAVRGGLGDWLLLRSFLYRRFVDKKRRRGVVAEFREGAIALGTFALVTAVILALVLFSRDLFPQDRLPPGQKPATAEETAFIFSALFAWLAIALGWLTVDFVGVHRIWMRIRQAFRISVAQPRAH